MHIGLSTLRHVLSTFGGTIRSNVAVPPAQGVVDLARQDRSVIHSQPHCLPSVSEHCFYRPDVLQFS